ncbi:Uncharacterised protein [Chromobacterium violaceum]|uniref:Uncharacterized protein n=1 Tax=Chromobacterium violaceum TaxID=536 RepID=A0A3S4LJC6_CHRVL|nr:Uncharacterised protein [Chromobacterium violaceum]
MANSLSVVGGKEIYDFDAGSLAQLQVRVTDLATGDGVPRHRVGFYIPAYRQGVSPGLLRMDDHSGGDGMGALASIPTTAAMRRSGSSRAAAATRPCCTSPSMAPMTATSGFGCSCCR